MMTECGGVGSSAAATFAAMSTPEQGKCNTYMWRVWRTADGRNSKLMKL